VATVLHIERLVGGDAAVEDQVLRFIAASYRAKNLLYLPRDVAVAIRNRPARFLSAAKRYCEPELGL
jgi:hypothetical protein